MLFNKIFNCMEHKSDNHVASILKLINEKQGETLIKNLKLGLWLNFGGGGAVGGQKAHFSYKGLT